MREAGWGVFDQSVCSLMSLVVGIVAARSLSATEFGIFALVLSAYFVCLGVSRALASEPLVVRFSGDFSGFRDRARDASGVAIVTGAILGAGLMAIGGVLHHASFGNGLMALGVVLPLLLTQDCLRFVAFATRRGAIAFAADLLWFATTLGSVGAAVLVGVTHAWMYILVWGGSAILPILLASVLLGVLPRPSSAVTWWRQQGDLAWRYVGEDIALTGVRQLSLYLIGWIAGFSAAGAIRGAQILMGPVTTVFVGVSYFALPEGVRRSKRGEADVLRFTRGVSGLLGALALVWIGVLGFFGEEIATVLLGASSAQAMDALPGVAMAMAALGVTSGAFVGLRAYAAARRSLRVRVVVAPLTLVGAAVGAFVDGARGGAVGLAIAGWVGATLWWWQFRAEREARRLPTEPWPDVSGHIAS